MNVLFVGGPYHCVLVSIDGVLSETLKVKEDTYVYSCDTSENGEIWRNYFHSSLTGGWKWPTQVHAEAYAKAKDATPIPYDEFLASLEPTPFDRVNTARLVRQIQESVGHMASTFAFSPSASEDFKKATDSYLESLKERGAISGFSISPPITRWKGWRELYPKRGTRLLAMIAKLLKLRDSGSPKWYHFVLPYSVDRGVGVQDEFYDYSVDKSEVERYVYPTYFASITYPHEVVSTDLLIAPTAPVRRIVLTCTIGKEGVSL